MGLRGGEVRPLHGTVDAPARRKRFRNFIELTQELLLRDSHLVFQIYRRATRFVFFRFHTTQHLLCAFDGNRLDVSISKIDRRTHKRRDCGV